MDLVEKEYSKNMAQLVDRFIRTGRKTNLGSVSLSSPKQSKPAWPVPRESKRKIK